MNQPIPTLQQNVESEFGALMFKLLSAATELTAVRAENEKLHVRIAELEAAQKPVE